MNGPGHIVVLENYSLFDGGGKLDVVLAESVDGGSFVAKRSAEMQDQDSVSVLLWR